MPRERHVQLVEVDFRLGGDPEQAMRGEVVSACLAEIDRCSHFVGLLGERYGEALHGVREELIKERWLDDPEGRSLAEVEILYSTLERSEQPKAAFFYGREPGLPSKHISREQRADFVSDFAEAQDPTRGVEAAHP